VTEELYAIRTMAHETLSPGAAVSATMAIAKLHGLLVNKKQDVTQDRERKLTDTELALRVAGILGSDLIEGENRSR
jgi:hypothetical protein